jgi:hypothetical protein
VLADIPDDSAAALLLIEHHWAVPLRDAIVRAGGFRLSDGFIGPLDLVEIGCCRPRTPRTCTPWRRPQPPEPGPDGQHHHDQEVTRMFGSRRVARRTARRTARRVDRRRR